MKTPDMRTFYRAYSHTRKSYFLTFIEGDDSNNFNPPGFGILWFPSRWNAVEWLAKNHPQEKFGDVTIEAVPERDLADHAFDRYEPIGYEPVDEPCCAVCGHPLPGEVDALRPLCDQHS